MTPHQFVALFVRLFVILAASYILISIPNTYFFLNQNNVATIWLTGFLTLIFIVLILLWNFPAFVSKKLLSNSIVQDENSASYKSWFEIGVLLIGLWLFVTAIPSLVQYGTLYTLTRGGSVEGGMPNTWNANLIGNFVKVILALVLLFNSSAIEKIIRKLRGR